VTNGEDAQERENKPHAQPGVIVACLVTTGFRQPDGIRPSLLYRRMVERMRMPPIPPSCRRSQPREISTHSKVVMKRDRRQNGRSRRASRGMHAAAASPTACPPAPRRPHVRPTRQRCHVFRLPLLPLAPLLFQRSSGARLGNASVPAGTGSR